MTERPNIEDIRELIRGALNIPISDILYEDVFGKGRETSDQLWMFSKQTFCLKLMSAQK